MTDTARVILHLVPPAPYTKSWVEVDGKMLLCKSVRIDFEANSLGTLVLEISLHRVDLSVEPLPTETEE